MQKIVSREVVVPFILITSLFFLWGIANDLTNPMVSAFKKVLQDLTNFEAALVQFAFYGGYATMAIPAALFIRKYSFKSGILIGLALYAVGTFLFYPAAYYEAFGFFLAALYILTFGLAFLETTSNPYILSMGDKQTATRRLNLSQAFNPMGSLCGMLIAQLYVLQTLKSDDYTKEAFNALSADQQAMIRAEDLSAIRDPYLYLGGLVLMIFIIILFSKLPKKESTKGELGTMETIKILLKNKCYYWGVIAQVFYVGCQIMCWTFIFQYVDNLNETLPKEQQYTATWYNMVAMILFLSGRWICTYLLKYMDAGKLMMFFSFGGIVCALGTILIVGYGGLLCLVGISIFMSLMFPTIYGIALKDMGEEAKLGSAGLVMAIVGGALMPPLQGKMLDIGGDKFNDVPILWNIPEVNYSFVLPLICLVVIAIYAYKSQKFRAEEKH